MPFLPFFGGLRLANETGNAVLPRWHSQRGKPYLVPCSLHAQSTFPIHVYNVYTNLSIN